jgi:hypothetical protein
MLAINKKTMKTADMRPLTFKKERRTEQLTIRVTPALMQRAKDVAEIEGVTLSDCLNEMLEWAVEAYAEQSEKKKR